MKLRTLIYILLCLLGVWALVQLYQQNREVFDQKIAFWGDLELRVSDSLLLFLVSGILITLFLGLTREFGSMLERRRWRMASRKAEEIEEEYSRGLVAVLEGHDGEAMTHFRAVLERDSRHYNTLLKLGEVLRHQRKFDEAIEYHKKAHHLREEDTRALYSLVEDYEAQGDLDRARMVLGKIIGINKNSVSAWRKLRALHIKQGNWERALEAQGKVLKLSRSLPSSAGADQRFTSALRYQIARQALEADKLKEAVAGLRKLLKDDGRFIPAHVKLGEALRALGQEAEAVQAWYAGFESTGSPIFLTTLEDHYLQQEQPLAAIEALKRCVSQARKDTLPRFYLGKLYFRLEMLDDALAVLSSLEGRATYAPTLHYLLGRIHERRANFRDAVLEYRRVIKEMDLVQLEYHCDLCGETIMEWVDRCPECGEWNCVEVNFREEISPEELGLSRAPIYSSRER